MAKNQNQKRGGDLREERADVHPGAATAWMIVRPTPGRERLFLQVAQAEGFDSYRPVLLKERYNRRARQITVTTCPMLPGYVLVRPRHPGDGYKVFSMPGLMPGEGGVLKTALLDVVVKELRSREKDGIIDQLKPPASPKRGQRVQTVAGLIDAVIEEVVDTNRITLLTGMFKGSARLTCRLDQVITH